MDDKLLVSAYSLVGWVAPRVSFGDWLAYARKARMRGGWLGLIGAEHELFGMLSYRNEESLRRGRIFHIDNFMTFELNRAAPGRMALREAAEGLARRQGCAAIEVRLDSRGFADDGTVKAQGWLNLGHHLEAVVFTKSLDDPPDANVAGHGWSAVEERLRSPVGAWTHELRSILQQK
jgi:hypothetical protein